MRRDYHRWFSGRLGREMGVVVYGHWGTPLLVFPTSGGDEWEMESQGMIDALGDAIEAGRIKVYTVGSNSDQSFYNHGAHPAHRSWMQRMWDEYISREVIPLIHRNCQGLVPTATMGASLGAYHAVNTLCKHPDTVKVCFGLSGMYDMKRFMDGHYDDNFYFNNPVDYLGGMTDPDEIARIASCRVHLVTGHGPWEHPEPTYRLSGILSSKGIPHHLDNWGERGGHDWPFWKDQMREYVKGL